MAVVNYNNSEKIFLSEGAFLIAIGLITVYLSQVSEYTFASVFSPGLFFIGLYRLINSIIARRNIVNPFLSVISAIFLIMTGIYLILNPLFEVVFLIVGTMMYLLTDSLVSFTEASEAKGQKQIFAISIFTGLVRLGLTAAVFYTSPFFALWISGLALGIDFVLAGIMYIAKYSYSGKPAYCVC